MTKFASPLRYPGGKNQLYQFIKDILIQHGTTKTYIEPFSGGAAVAIRLLLNNNKK